MLQPPPPPPPRRVNIPSLAFWTTDMSYYYLERGERKKEKTCLHFFLLDIYICRAGNFRFWSTWDWSADQKWASLMKRRTACVAFSSAGRCLFFWKLAPQFSATQYPWTFIFQFGLIFPRNMRRGNALPDAAPFSFSFRQIPSRPSLSQFLRLKNLLTDDFKPNKIYIETLKLWNIRPGFEEYKKQLRYFAE